MKTTKLKIGFLMAGSALGGLLFGQVAPSAAQDLGDILKGGLKGAAIIVVVDRLAPQINQGINALTGNKTDGVRETTKVVPVLEVGKGTYIGAVQVSGPKSQTDQVKAVAYVRGEFKVGSPINAQVYIPVSLRNVKDIGSLSRVRGVGVSALVDIKL